MLTIIAICKYAICIFKSLMRILLISSHHNLQDVVTTQFIISIFTHDSTTLNQSKNILHIFVDLCNAVRMPFQSAGSWSGLTHEWSRLWSDHCGMNETSDLRSRTLSQDRLRWHLMHELMSSDWSVQGCEFVSTYNCCWSAKSELSVFRALGCCLVHSTVNLKLAGKTSASLSRKIWEAINLPLCVLTGGWWHHQIWTLEFICAHETVWWGSTKLLARIGLSVWHRSGSLPVRTIPSAFEPKSHFKSCTVSSQVWIDQQ